MAVSTLLSLSTSASANPIAGGGYSSAYSGESAFTNAGAGETGQFSAIFFNDGSTTWQPGVVGLLVCAADKITCNISSNATFAKNWYSSTVYATVTTSVAPGQNGFFIYNFTVPDGTPPGTVTSFYGDVGLIATGAEFRPEGYFQVNTAPAPSLSLVISPTSASITVGQTQQFTVTNLPTGATATWTVLGGCGAITASGLFAATAMNSASQPCAVVATIPGSSGSAPITVFGQPTQLGCSATPTTLVANGGTTSAGIATATVSLKDANGNVVSNAGSPLINVVNVTPTLATMTPTGTLAPAGGVVRVTVTSTNTPGDIQLSASATGLTGCNVIISSGGVGAATKTIATFLTTPLAADNTSTTTLQVDVTDANGNRVASDNATQLTITRDASSANVCNVTGVTQGTVVGGVSQGGTTATVSAGRAQFTIQATSTPGQCLITVTTNNPTIAGTSATVQTQIVGAPNKLAVLSNDSPHPASAPGTCVPGGGGNELSCTTVVVGVQDVNGALITSATNTITATPGSNCTGAGGGSVVVRNAPTTSGGKATFVFSSQGAYANCTITFSSSGLGSASTTAVWTAGGANHLACVFTPTSIPPDGSATAVGQVSVRDSLNNVVPDGTYSVSFAKISGSSTVLLSGQANPQNTSGGYAIFTVRSTTTVGTDTYGPSLASGSLTGANTTCTIIVQP